MKTLLLFSALALTLTSCTTDAAGNKAFLGLNSKQWLGVGEDATKSATQTAIVSYGTRRAVTAAKQPRLVNP